MAMNIEDFFWQELSKAQDRMPTDISGSLFIRCPNPEHSGGRERTPSLRLNYDGKFAGQFKCYGCNWKGHWNDLASILNLQKLNAASTLHSDSSANAIRKSSLKNALGQAQVFERPRVLDRETDWFPDTDWRGISGEVLSKIGAKLVINEYGNTHIRFPAFYHGKRIGHVTAFIEKPQNGLPSYLESKDKVNGHSWSDSNTLFFDYCHERLKSGKNRTVFIVEGPRDALRLLSFGLCAVPLLGVSKLEDKKIRTFLNLNAASYVVMTDGDSAGERAGDILIKKLTRQYVSTDRVKLPEGTDPMDLPCRIIKKLKQTYET